VAFGLSRPSALAVFTRGGWASLMSDRHRVDEDPNPGRSWGPRSGSIELIWHRANTSSEIEAFLKSDVEWAECDARMDRSGVVRVSHDPLEGDAGSASMDLTSWMEILRSARRRAKIDLKEGGPVLEEALRTAGVTGFPDEDLWFNATVEVPAEAGFRRIAETRPGARCSCPLDTITPYLLVMPDGALPILDVLRSWGLNWLCIGVCEEGVSTLVPILDGLGWRVNIWGVKDSDDLDFARSLHPDAITADLGSI
jgi:hypothetical protein